MPLLYCSDKAGRTLDADVGFSGSANQLLALPPTMVRMANPYK